jgi:hypothetical protein
MTGVCSTHGIVKVGPLGTCPECGEVCFIDDEEAE